MAPRHAEDDGMPHPPREPPIDRHEQALPEQLPETPPAHRAWPAQVAPRQVGLCGLEQVLLGIAPDPFEEPHGQPPPRPFCAASAIGSLSAPIAGEYTFSIQASSSSVTPFFAAIARKSHRSLIFSPLTSWAPIRRSVRGSASSFTRIFLKSG